MRDQRVRPSPRGPRIALAICVVSVVAACDSDDVTAPSTTVATAPPVSAAPTVGASVTTGAPSTTPSTTPSPTAPQISSPTVDTAAIDTTAVDTTTLDARVLRHPAGLELRYPTGWTESSGSKIATEFASDADCRSVTVVDFEPPIDTGEAEAGFALKSVVQVCARPAERSSVDDYLEIVYGGTAGFERIEIDGEPAYRRGTLIDSVAFTLHDDFTFQILTSVVSDSTLERQRIAEVDRIVESITFA